jgi:hypothetical protein
VTAENFHSGWSDGWNGPMQSPGRRKDGCRGVSRWEGSRLYGSLLSPARVLMGLDHTLPNQKIGGFCGVRNFMWLAQSPERKATSEGWPRAVSIKRSNSFNKHSNTTIQPFHSIPSILQKLFIHTYIFLNSINHHGNRPYRRHREDLSSHCKPFCKKQRSPSS